MNRAVVYGVVLLAACTAPPSRAFAWSNLATGATPSLFFVGATAAHGVPGYLGVDLRDVTEDQLSALKLSTPRGAEIILVDHDAPAGKADLRVHDVIVQMNGQPIDGQDQLRRLLHDLAPGKTVTFIISREGMQMTVTTQMANREAVERHAWEQHLTVPEPQSAATESPEPSYPAPNSPPIPHVGNSFISGLLMTPSYTGVMLEKMSPQLAGFFGVSSGSGLLVRSVQPNSPAAIAGMHAGDVVVRADERALTNNSDWTKALKNSHGKPLIITVLRDKKEQILTLTPDGKKRSSLDQPDDGTAFARLGLSWMPRS